MTIVNVYAIDAVAMNEHQPKQIKLPSQAITIGSGTIGTLPGEFFVKTGYG